MKMKQFFHLTFIFLIIACLAHSAGAITDLEKRWHAAPISSDNQYIAVMYNR